jgi:hypothetical protein
VIGASFKGWNLHPQVREALVEELKGEVSAALSERYYSPINGGTLRRYIEETTRGMAKDLFHAEWGQALAKAIAAEEYKKREEEERNAAAQANLAARAALTKFNLPVVQPGDHNGTTIYPAWWIAHEHQVSMRSVYRWMKAHDCGKFNGTRMLTEAQRQAFAQELDSKRVLKYLRTGLREHGFSDAATWKKVQRLSQQMLPVEEMLRFAFEREPRTYRKRTI